MCDFANAIDELMRLQRAHRHVFNSGLHGAPQTVTIKKKIQICRAVVLYNMAASHRKRLVCADLMEIFYVITVLVSFKIDDSLDKISAYQLTAQPECGWIRSN